MDVLGESVDSAPLHTMATKIIRGVQMPAAVLRDLTTDEETSIVYLSPQDIEDGFISNDLPFLKSCEPDWPYLQDGDVVLSRNSANIKVAVAEVSEGRTVICSDALYIIRIDDPSVLSPYFLKGLLESNLGSEMLRHASVGVATQVIGLKQLRDMKVPLLPREEQESFEEQYRDRSAVIRQTLKDLRIAQDGLRTYVDSFMVEVSMWRLEER